MYNTYKNTDFAFADRMLKDLPACIFLKDNEGKYVFSTQYWNHLDTKGDPNWTIRGKTDLDIRKDKKNAMKAMEADRRIIALINNITDYQLLKLELEKQAKTDASMVTAMASDYRSLYYADLDKDELQTFWETRGTAVSFAF